MVPDQNGISQIVLVRNPRFVQEQANEFSKNNVAPPCIESRNLLADPYNIFHDTMCSTDIKQLLSQLLIDVLWVYVTISFSTKGRNACLSFAWFLKLSIFKALQKKL